jgi:hypothetical protein
MDITFELIKLIVISIVMAFVFGLIRVAKKNQETGEAWDWLKFAPTAIYSVILGFIMAWTGIINFNNLADFAGLFDGTWVAYLTLYTTILYVWENIVIPFIKNRLTVVVKDPAQFVRPATVDPLRQMDQETREWLVKDQPEPYKGLILKAVDTAQDQKVIRYAISAGAWEFLIEFGIVTGGKHYLWKGWFGSGVVVWKAISSACLEAIRSTGKWPDYDKLY